MATPKGTFTPLCIIDVISVRAIGYETGKAGTWSVVESAKPSLLPFGHVADAAVWIIARPGDVVFLNRREVTFSHLTPGPNGWVAMVSDGESCFPTDPFKLEVS